MVLLTIIADPADACDCDHFSGGCKIVSPASRGTACKCSYTETCGPAQEPKLAASYYCDNPDKTVHSSYLGGGDCGSY